MREDKGFSLVELLVTMSIVGLLMTAIYSVLSHQNRTYETQQQVADVQRDMRSALTRLRREIRMIGYGLRENTLPIQATSNNRPSARGTDAMTFNANLGAGTLVIPSSAGASYALGVGELATVRVASTAGFSPATPYSVDFIDPGTGTLVTSAFLTGISISDGTVTVRPQQSASLWAGTYIGLPYQTISYRVDTEKSLPSLIRDNGAGFKVIAQGVEDFQVAYGFDGLNDYPQNGLITEIGARPNDDEWVYNVSGDVWPANLSRLRMIRVSLLLRTKITDRDFLGETEGQLEDHGWVLGHNGYRQRLIRFTETIRNLSL